MPPLPKPLLKPGENCWRRGTARRAAVIVDAAAYFEALHRNLRKAQEAVYFLGWDIDSRQSLIPGVETFEGWPVRFGELLLKLVEERPSLHVHLLCWDYSSIYTFGREAFQSLKLGLAHDRIHFKFDGEHPVSASHHQKIIVVDDALAFSGGLDVTSARWDTTRHDPRDERRVMPSGQPFAPFHDVQMAVTGEPARWLGELARERWALCTGQSLVPPSLAADLASYELPTAALRDACVAVARTVPAYKTVREVREVERLFLDTINAARRYLYIENQYFTCACITDALAASLRRRRGPEIVVIIPKVQDNWISKRSMGTLSSVAISKLREADRYRRFHALYPEDTRLEGEKYINVHAKVMVADGQTLRVGSANINNRSMGLDTECDLIVDGAGDERTLAWIEDVVAYLASHHVGAEPNAVREAWRTSGSLAAALRSCAQAPKSLEPYVCAALDTVDDLVKELAIVDPERPIGLDRLLDDFVFRGRTARELALLSRVPTLYWLTILIAVLLTFSTAIAPFPIHLGGWELLAAFIALGALCVPLNVMVALAACLLPGARAFALALAGGVLVAGLGYGLGRILPESLVQRRSRYYMRQVRSRGGLLPMVVVRLFPVAPFTVMNAAAGRAGVPLGRFFAGTLMALVPGALGVVMLVRSLLLAVEQPSFGTVALFLAVSLAWSLVFYWGARRLSPPTAERSTPSWVRRRLVEATG